MSGLNENAYLKCLWSQVARMKKCIILSKDQHFTEAWPTTVLIGMEQQVRILSLQVQAVARSFPEPFKPGYPDLLQERKQKRKE